MKTIPIDIYSSAFWIQVKEECNDSNFPFFNLCARSKLFNQMFYCEEESHQIKNKATQFLSETKYGETMEVGCELLFIPNSKGVKTINETAREVRNAFLDWMIQKTTTISHEK
jgi:hypothetical protein